MPRDVDEFDSHGVRTLADKIASGKLSVTAAAECTEAFVSDGANKALGADKNAVYSGARGVSFEFTYIYIYISVYIYIKNIIYI